MQDQPIRLIRLKEVMAILDLGIGEGCSIPWHFSITAFSSTPSDNTIRNTKSVSLYWMRLDTIRR